MDLVETVERVVDYRNAVEHPEGHVGLEVGIGSAHKMISASCLDSATSDPDYH